MSPGFGASMLDPTNFVAGWGARGLIGSMERRLARDTSLAVEKGFASGGRATLSPPRLGGRQVRRLTAQVERRMAELGIPRRYRGIRGDPSTPRGFDPHLADIGSNMADMRFGGINVGAGILRPPPEHSYYLLQSIEARIDAAIAHEWLEFRGLTHAEAVAAGPSTSLNILPAARILLYLHPDRVP
jgi:hypothetical protein